MWHEKAVYPWNQKSQRDLSSVAHDISDIAEMEVNHAHFNISASALSSFYCIAEKETVNPRSSSKSEVWLIQLLTSTCNTLRTHNHEWEGAGIDTRKIWRKKGAPQCWEDQIWGALSMLFRYWCGRRRHCIDGGHFCFFSPIFPWTYSITEDGMVSVMVQIGRASCRERV